MLREWWERLSRVEAGSSRGFFVAVVMAMGFVTIVAAIVGLLGGGMIPLVIAGLFWPAFLLVALLRGTALEHGANLLTAKGGSTPYVAQHSNIQALVAKGAFAEAAEAYRREIAAHPEDLLACEQLSQLALRELKDYELALFATHEAEKRTPDARRKAGFALLAVNIYSDNLKDYGKTMVELRRLLARYPDIPNADRLRAEIDELKALHFQSQ